ncbi:MAG: HU family DNA-binding protein [Verrucomicrobiota bacterium]|jgi:DNA-binding protein HU-beta
MNGLQVYRDLPSRDDLSAPVVVRSLVTALTAADRGHVTGVLTWIARHFALRSRAMAKALTKSQIAASVAETVGLTKKQAVQTIEALVALAYKNAKNSFTVPGLGKLVLVNRKARMGRNPATGEQITIAAKRAVKFRISKAAKDAILGAKK